MESDPANQTVAFLFEHPAADMGLAGNDVSFEGSVVWQKFQGDWYDAAMIYRAWVRREAFWFPELSGQGRVDTPRWMRELSAWVQIWRPDEEWIVDTKVFADYVGVPVGAHIYNWANQPHDTDYPHYFPAQPHFGGAVKALKEAGVRVMPYINGRLWDMRDRGIEDFEFTSTALPFATKDEKGDPYVEDGPPETDGKNTRFAVMCPATGFWKEKIRDLALRLFGEFDVDGVYVDQVAAMSPRLCMDASHGHALGGGDWWNRGYWDMLAKIRGAMPPGAMLTTECNSEPFIRWFDGYLVWHWQKEGMVPAFMAVYSPAVQLFGRAYQLQSSERLATNMRCGQQLVFGEQIGWFYPDIIEYPENASFIRQCVRLRWRLRSYFSTGELARPPRLTGEIPKVRADWHWGGTTFVTTDALMAGAWFLPGENTLVLIFANVSDEPVTTTLDFDAARYGLTGNSVRVISLAGPGGGDPVTEEAVFSRTITFPERSAVAYEVKPNH